MTGGRGGRFAVTVHRDGDSAIVEVWDCGGALTHATPILGLTIGCPVSALADGVLLLDFVPMMPLAPLLPVASPPARPGLSHPR